MVSASVSVYVYVSMCICKHVCVWCAKCKIRHECQEQCELWNFLKIHNFKNIIDRCIISFLLVASVWVHNCAKYKGSKFNHVDRKSQMKNFSKMAAI